MGFRTVSGFWGNVLLWLGWARGPSGDGLLVQEAPLGRSGLGARPERYE